MIILFVVTNDAAFFIEIWCLYYIQIEIIRWQITLGGYMVVPTTDYPKDIEYETSDHRYYVLCRRYPCVDWICYIV